MATDKRCKCTMAQSLTGDGCRYCQPQEYIDRLEDFIDEMEDDLDYIDRLEVIVDMLEKKLEDAENEIARLSSLGHDRR